MKSYTGYKDFNFDFNIALTTGQHYHAACDYMQYNSDDSK